MLKEKIIEVECYTYLTTVFNTFKIVPAIQYYPEWWKKLPKKDRNTNMLSCKGFTELYKNSYILPMWYRALFTGMYDKNCQEKKIFWETTGQHNYVTSIQSDEFKNFANDQHYIKFTCPWILKTKESLNLSISDPLWNRPDFNAYCIPPTVINTKYDRQIYINMYFNHREGKLASFFPGDPLVHITPLTEKKVKFNFYLISEREYLEEVNTLATLNFFRKDISSYSIFKTLIDRN